MWMQKPAIEHWLYGGYDTSFLLRTHAMAYL